MLINDANISVLQKLTTVMFKLWFSAVSVVKKYMKHYFINEELEREI